MDWILVLLIFAFGSWFMFSVWRRNGDRSVSQTNEIKVHEKVADWQISYQIKQNFRHKSAYKKALLKNDISRIKVHKAMLVFGKSLLGYFSYEFRSYIRNLQK